MVISWLISGNLKQHNGRWTSEMASNRLRVLLPAETLAVRGHEIYINTDINELIDDNLQSLRESDVVIVAKSFNEEHLHVVQKAKELNKIIIIDICDNYFFRDAKMLQHYQNLISYADCIVANSQGMADSLSSRFEKSIVVIEDPYENSIKPPKFRPDSELLKLVWFGYDRNLQPLINEILNIGKISEIMPVRLKIVTNKNDSLITEIENFNRKYGNSFSLEYIPWSLESTRQAIHDSDIVLIPNKLIDDGLVKSSNRIIESLLAGRFVCASPIPSYVEFGSWTYVGNNLIEGILWALKNPEIVEVNIKKAQEYIVNNYSPEVIGNKWITLLNEIVDKPDEWKPLTRISDSIKLNLGCGDKILPGFVNVDVVAARAGKEPDVICDLHDLHVFSDNFADEILSVHVIEHFWRWEVEEVLKEWIRVLKPGGKMVIECPNLKSACEEFLKNPEAAASGGPEGQRSMWVFYGDPRWQDPLMVHRWGYTPESLGTLLQSVGLVNIRQEPAQYKLREPRDMRIVAEKA